MPTFLYRCPKTAQTVQGWAADDFTKDRADTDAYETIECVACRAASVTMGVTHSAFRTTILLMTLTNAVAGSLPTFLKAT